MSVAEILATDKILGPTDETLCEHCLIAPVKPGDKYCESCVLDVLEYLAREN